MARAVSFLYSFSLHFRKTRPHHIPVAVELSVPPKNQQEAPLSQLTLAQLPQTHDFTQSVVELNHLSAPTSAPAPAPTPAALVSTLTPAPQEPLTEVLTTSSSTTVKDIDVDKPAKAAEKEKQKEG